MCARNFNRQNEEFVTVENKAPTKQSGVSPSTIVLIFFVTAAGYFLWTEHKAHVIQFLPWIFLLLCPLMHLFMHGGHRGGHGGGGDRDSGPHSHNDHDTP